MIEKLFIRLKINHDDKMKTTQRWDLLRFQQLMRSKWELPLQVVSYHHHLCYLDCCNHPLTIFTVTVVNIVIVVIGSVTFFHIMIVINPILFLTIAIVIIIINIIIISIIIIILIRTNCQLDDQQAGLEAYNSDW